MRTTIRKTADIMVAGLIAIVIGLLFSWWVAMAVFLFGLAIILRPKRSAIEPPWRQMASEEDEVGLRSLQEWTDCEVTHGPSAPGLSNPSRQD